MTPPTAAERTPPAPRGRARRPGARGKDGA
jgi:hypothetical protein